ncbi:acyl transferase [Putridiphycobacter roseus]|uniref:Acyl transferase n=1 Tax=Putridiphycobacter roseus TaxID=2219161 RepID=A0A2W1N3P6_9FLAO|nr:acyl transferase [Putridiphycobacter roseus]
MDFLDKIQKINNNNQFEKLALELFNYQFSSNSIYQKYCLSLRKTPENVKSLNNIPFLPISFFKSHEVKSGNYTPVIAFSSSGTTGMERSQHFVKDMEVYEKTFEKAFELFYDDPSNYVVIGLLPSYLEREGSSLVYMVDHLIKASGHSKSGFYLNNYEELVGFLKDYQGEKQILLIGVSYALLDLGEMFEVDLSKYIVMETGGMKGKRKEMTKATLHQTLQENLKLTTVHSEYGMTELMSQAYSKGNGVFQTPPWMKVLIREYNDPFNYIENKTGGINVIDLANIDSCAFIETEDLGKYNKDGFEVIGRLDTADLRGCNLLVQ